VGLADLAVVAVAVDDHDVEVPAEAPDVLVEVLLDETRQAGSRPPEEDELRRDLV
jgi:hypothetical protein